VLTEKASECFKELEDKRFTTISLKVEKLENTFSAKELALITLGAYNGQRILQDLLENGLENNEDCDCEACTLKRELQKKEDEKLKKVIFPSGPMGKA
jgi:hypothetical protein